MRQLDLLGVAADTANDGIEALAAWAAGQLCGGARRHPHAAHGRPRAHASAARGRGRTRQPAGARTPDGRRHRQRHERRGGALSRRRHGRLSGQAGADMERCARRWNAGCRWATAREGGKRRRRTRPPALRSTASVLAAWLGDDDAAIDSLLAKFRDTAIEAEREIVARIARRRSRDAWPPRRTSSRVRRRRSARPKSAPPPPRSNRPARPAIAPAAARDWGRLPRNCAARSSRSTDRRQRHDLPARAAHGNGRIRSINPSAARTCSRRRARCGSRRGGRHRLRSCGAAA